MSIYSSQEEWDNLTKSLCNIFDLEYSQIPYEEPDIIILETPEPWNKGKKVGPHTEEHRRNIGIGGKGKIPWNKGIECPQISKSLSGRKNPIHGDKLRGKKASIETRKKMSESHKGNKSSLGHKHSEETKEKMRNRTPIYVTRLYDKKVMTVQHFSNWNKRFSL